MENETNVNESTERTYSEKEFQSEVDKRVSQALKTQQSKFDEQLKEADKLARMNEQEKLTYELEKRQKELDDREALLNIAEAKNVAISILSEKHLSGDLVDLVLGKDAEETNTKIKILEDAFNSSVKDEVQKRLSGKAPKSFSNSDSLTREDFKKMSLKEQQKLATSDPDLYKNLINN